MSYLIKVDYVCPEVRTGGKWKLYRGEKPELGETSEQILPTHSCQKDNYRQSCEDDSNCTLQRILEIKPLRETKRLTTKID